MNWERYKLQSTLCNQPKCMFYPHLYVNIERLWLCLYDSLPLASVGQYPHPVLKIKLHQVLLIFKLVVAPNIYSGKISCLLHCRLNCGNFLTCRDSTFTIQNFCIHFQTRCRCSALSSLIITCFFLFSDRQAPDQPTQGSSCTHMNSDHYLLIVLFILTNLLYHALTIGH